MIGDPTRFGIDPELVAKVLRILAQHKARPATKRGYYQRQRDRAVANLRRYGPLRAAGGVGPGDGPPNPPAVVS